MNRQDRIPFPVLNPPIRSAILGGALSLLGSITMAVLALGGGLAGVGLVACLCIIYFLITGDQSVFLLSSLHLMIPIAMVLLGIPLAVAAAHYTISLRTTGRRLRSADARPLLRSGKKPLVLFIRSFDDEDLQEPRPMDFFQHRYEERIAAVVSRLGKPISIGSPRHNLGFAGAARLYVKDSVWQEAVLYLMDRATAVVITVGQTSGLWWEIAAAIRRVQAQRLLFFFPYVYKYPQTDSLIKSYIALHRRSNIKSSVFRKMAAEREARYQQFRQRCTPLFTTAVPREIADALFMDIELNGSARLLNSRQKPLWTAIFGLSNLMVDLTSSKRKRLLRPDYKTTLKPFLKKLTADESSIALKPAVAVPMIERVVSLATNLAPSETKRETQWPKGALNHLLGGLTLVLIASFIFVVTVAPFITSMLKSTVPYHWAFVQAKANPELLSRLGTPVTPPWFNVFGSLVSADGKTSIDLEYTIMGPNGEAEVIVKGDKVGENWAYRTAGARIGESFISFLK